MFHLPVTGQLSQAAHSVQEIVDELGGPSVPYQALASPDRRQNKLNTPPAPQSPFTVRVVQPSAGGWKEVRDLGTPVLAPLGLAAMVLIFTGFMLLKREDLRNRLLRLARLGHLNRMTQALDDASGRVSRYLLIVVPDQCRLWSPIWFRSLLYWRTQRRVMGSGRWHLAHRSVYRDVDSATLPIALSLAVFDGWLPPLVVFFLVASLELIVANFIEPWLYGAHVGISSLALLVSSVFWAVLWGPAGLILSTPLTVCVVVLGCYVPHLSFLHILLGDESVLAAEAQIYQRLLAMDQLEVQAILAGARPGKSLVELYDSVLSRR